MRDPGEEVVALREKLAVYERVFKQVQAIVDAIGAHHDGCACRSRMLELEAAVQLAWKGRAVYHTCRECRFKSIMFSTGEYKPTPESFVCYECFLVAKKRIEPLADSNHEKKSRPQSSYIELRHDRFELIEME